MAWAVNLTRLLVSAAVHVERRRRDQGGRRSAPAGRRRCHLWRTLASFGDLRRPLACLALSVVVTCLVSTTYRERPEYCAR
jgi:hypothetical protein